MANVWHDKRLIYVMSTNTNADNHMTCRRKEKNGSISEVTNPKNTYLYNKYMACVDKADQFRGTINGNSSPGSFTCMLLL